MYRELIEKLIEGHSWAKLQEPCSEKNITNAEKYVGFSFPEELKALLRETNETVIFCFQQMKSSATQRITERFFQNSLKQRNLKRRSIALFSLQQMVVEIITAIVFLKTAKQIQRQFTFGSTNCLKSVRLQKTLLN